jgi:hypothetical protein
MSWFKLDDKSTFHRKVVAVGNAAWGAFCRLGTHSSDQGADGFVSSEVARLIAAEDELARLETVGLLERCQGGYSLHDFLKYNPSAKEVAKTRKQRASAGSAGGSKRQANAKRVLEQRPSNAQAEAKQTPGAPNESAQAKVNPVPTRPVPSRPVPTHGGESALAPVWQPERSETPPPADLEITEAIRTNCIMAGGRPPTPADVTAMLASARSKGKRSCDWPAEVALWMKRERGYEIRDGGTPEPPPPRARGRPRPAPQ